VTPVLVDTSVWVDYLRGADTRATSTLRELLAAEPLQVVTTEPVAMEVLAGATEQATLTRLERLVNGLPSLEVDPAVDFRSAAAVFRACRGGGTPVRALVDCLIAAVAIRHGAELVHKDADFESIARVAPLAHRSLR
jgi:predicted nucleic acid-binding protein